MCALAVECGNEVGLPVPYAFLRALFVVADGTLCSAIRTTCITLFYVKSVNPVIRNSGSGAPTAGTGRAPVTELWPWQQNSGLRLQGGNYYSLGLPSPTLKRQSAQ